MQHDSAGLCFTPEADINIPDDICIQFPIGSIFIQDTKGLGMTEGLFVWTVFRQS